MTQTAGRPRCAAALSTQETTREALDEVCREALAELAAEPHLALLFASPPHLDDLASLTGTLCDRLGTENLLGCSGESIVGGGREIEGEAALSLWLAHLPGAGVETMHLRLERTAEGGSFVGWPDSLAGAWPQGSSLVLLGDPFTFPADALLERLNDDRPGVPVVGGMASGGYAPGEVRLILGREMLDEGAVAVRLGGVRLRTVVSQGCRPVGRPFVITRAEQNVILELGGKPPLAQLNELFPSLSPREQQLVRSGLHVGRVTSEYQDRFERGDFLIRNVIGADPDSGALAVGDYMRTGQTVQFHLRDDQTADEELKQLLVAAREQGAEPAGGLLFTCNGRGTRLFTEPHHDAAALHAAWPGLPLAGFFAQGELGPVGPRNFLHGFTASIALIEAAS